MNNFICKWSYDKICHVQSSICLNLTTLWEVLLQQNHPVPGDQWFISLSQDTHPRLFTFLRPDFTLEFFLPCNFGNINTHTQIVSPSFILKAYRSTCTAFKGISTIFLIFIAFGTIPFLTVWRYVNYCNLWEVQLKEQSLFCCKLCTNRDSGITNHQAIT